MLLRVMVVLAVALFDLSLSHLPPPAPRTPPHPHLHTSPSSPSSNTTTAPQPIKHLIAKRSFYLTGTSNEIPLVNEASDKLVHITTNWKKKQKQVCRIWCIGKTGKISCCDKAVIRLQQKEDGGKGTRRSAASR